MMVINMGESMHGKGVPYFINACSKVGPTLPSSLSGLLLYICLLQRQILSNVSQSRDLLLLLKRNFSAF